MKFYDFYFDEYIISSLFFSFFTHDLFKTNSSLFYFFFYHLLQENRDKDYIIDFSNDFFKKIKNIHSEKIDGFHFPTNSFGSFGRSPENSFSSARSDHEKIDYSTFIHSIPKNSFLSSAEPPPKLLIYSPEQSEEKTKKILSQHPEFLKYFFPFFTLLEETLPKPKIPNIEMNPFFNKKNNSLDDFNNYIIFGPPCSGKYSQSLLLFFLLSPSLLKYQKKILLQNDKFKFFFFISDIHYEIDISLLGCNSKLIWADLFSYIIDMISVNPLKKGIILCKNFDSIHNELLETFYSYIQHYNHNLSNIKISFVIITENISFIPNNIINICNVLSIPKPNLNIYKKILNIVEKSPSFNFPTNSVDCSPERREDEKMISQERVVDGSTGSDTKIPMNLSERINSFDEGSDEVKNEFYGLKCRKIIDKTYDNFPTNSFGRSPENSFLSERIEDEKMDKSVHESRHPRDKVDFFQKILTTPLHNKKINLHFILKSISDMDVNENMTVSNLKNIKEIHTESMLKSNFSTNSFCRSPEKMNNEKEKVEHSSSHEEMPKNLLNIICDGIIHEMINYQKINMLKFRDMIYDILIYNLNVYDCVWYIIEFFVEWENPLKKISLSGESIDSFDGRSVESNFPANSFGRSPENSFSSDRTVNEFFGLESIKIRKILKKTYSFLKYYNNNYRPIYHLEHFFYYMLVIIHDI
jgi:hypothetical protein